MSHDVSKARPVPTPWGDSDRLSERRLPPGPGSRRDRRRRNQRERLLAATVAVIADKGYDAARVADILAAAGVSRATFYDNFANKQECVTTTIGELLDLLAPRLLRGAHGESPEERLRGALDALARTVVAQPAAARLCYVEAYAAGDAALRRVEGVRERIEQLVADALRAERSPEISGELVRAIVAGLHKVFHTRVRLGTEQELVALVPELVAWAVSYRVPPDRLRRPRKVPPQISVTRSWPRDQRGRMLAAVAEIVADNGYPALTIGEIASRAGVSLTTFYQEFSTKEEAFLASLDHCALRLFDTMASVFGSSPDWPYAIALASHAFFGFMVHDPSAAWLGGRDVWRMGRSAQEVRQQAQDRFAPMLEEGFRRYPDTPRIASEAIAGSVDWLLYDGLLRLGASRLYELAPTAAFLGLGPFMGAREACRIANMSMDELQSTGRQAVA